MRVPRELPVVLAIDIGGTKVSAALVRDGEVLTHERLPTPARAGPDAVVSAAVTACQRVMTEAYPAPVALGAACAGVVRDGRVHALSQDLLPGWHGYPLVSQLEERLTLTATAVNDAQAAAYGEWRYGAGVGLGSLLFVTVSTGVGGGLVVDGTLWRGASGLAGHVGHMAGCEVERTASGTALARRAAEVGHPEADARMVINEAAAGSVWAQILVTEAAAALARMLADVKLLVDPAVAVLGGGVGLNPVFREAVVAQVKLGPEHLQMPVVPARLEALAGLVGAAALARSEWQKPPP